MKKNVLFNSETALYTLVMFFVNVLFMPDAYLLFDTHTLRLRENYIGVCVFATLALLVLSAVSAVIFQKLFYRKDEFLSVCGVLILADTLFKSNALNFVHMILLAASMALAVYLAEGKSFLLKTVLMCVSAVVLPVVSPDSAFCQLPLILLAYGFAIAKEKEGAPALKNKKGNKQKTENGIKETVLASGLSALGIGLGVLLEDDIAAVIASGEYNAAANVNFSNGGLWIAFAPYAIVLVAFVCGFFAAKSKEMKQSLGNVIVRSDALWLAVVAFGLVLYGIIFAKLPASITVFNGLMIETVVLLYLQGSKSSQKSADGILAFARRYKYAVSAIAIVWFLVTQFVLKNVQFSLLDRLLSMVGGTL